MAEKCGCCDKEKDIIGVACIPFMPMSIAWCQDCLEAGAIPYNMAVWNTSMIGSYDLSNEGWKEIVDKTILYFNKSKEQFDADVAKELADEKMAYPVKSE